MMDWWNRLKERYEYTVAAYGKAAFAVYLTLFFGTWVAFWFAIRTGVDVQSAGGDAGTIGGAWVATKVTQPVRILATVVLTPVAVGAMRRWVPQIAQPGKTADRD